MSSVAIVFELILNCNDLQELEEVAIWKYQIQKIRSGGMARALSCARISLVVGRDHYLDSVPLTHMGATGSASLTPIMFTE